MAVTINGTTGIDTPSLTADTTTLVVDETNNRVGIGTTSPAHKLTVAGYSNADASNKLSIGEITDYQGLIHMESATETLTIENTSDYPLRAIIFKHNATEVGRFDADANLRFNSGYGSVATAYGCRVWAKFQGSGTVGLSQGGNVSTVGDNGTGDYTVNFSTAMPDVDYCAVTSGHENIGTYTRDLVPAGNYGTTSVRVRVYGGLYDISVANVAIFR